jgi:large subunit ribosomal protein L17
MRHRKQNQKLGRSGAHREALVSALVVALIKRRSIETTTVKAKIARQTAEKMVTLARKGTLAARRLAASRLRDEEAAAILFKDITPMFEGRAGGYTRIIKTSARGSDGSEMAILQWVESSKPVVEQAEPAAAKA